MRTLLLLITLAGWATGALAGNSPAPYAELLKHTGITQILDNAPADITRAADRHAARCHSTAFKNSLTAKGISQAIVTRLEWQHPREEVQQLLSWYTSSIGKKAKKLEARQINEQALQLHQPDDNRLQKIRQIYQNTSSGKLIPQTAVEIEYSGWSLSGCLENAEAAGDIKSMHKEMTRALEIKKEAKMLEALFKEDTLLTMAYLLAPLSLEELTEYADATEQNARLYSTLVSSLVNAVRAEVKK